MRRKSLACVSALSLVGSSLACADAKSDKEKFLEYFDSISLRSALIDENTVYTDLKKRFPFVKTLSIDLPGELARWVNVYGDHIDKQSLLALRRGLIHYLADRISHVTKSLAYFQKRKSLSKFYKLLYSSAADGETSMLEKYFSKDLTKNEAQDVVNCFKSLRGMSSFNYDDRLIWSMAPLDAYFTGVDIDFSKLLGSGSYFRFALQLQNFLDANFTRRGVEPLDVLLGCLTKNKFQRSSLPNNVEMELSSVEENVRGAGGNALAAFEDVNLNASRIKNVSKENFIFFDKDNSFGAENFFSPRNWFLGPSDSKTVDSGKTVPVHYTSVTTSESSLYDVGCSSAKPLDLLWRGDIWKRSGSEPGKEKTNSSETINSDFSPDGRFNYGLVAGALALVSTAVTAGFLWFKGKLSSAGVGGLQRG